MTQVKISLNQLQEEIRKTQNQIDQQHRQIQKGLDNLERLGKYLGQLDTNKAIFMEEDRLAAEEEKAKKAEEEKQQEEVSDVESERDRVADSTE